MVATHFREIAQHDLGNISNGFQLKVLSKSIKVKKSQGIHLLEVRGYDSNGI